MSKFGHLGSKFEKRNLVENSRFPLFLKFGSFWVVLQAFGVGLAGFGSFWFVPGFSKYGVITHS